MQQRMVGGVDGQRVSTFCLGVMTFGTTVDEATSFAILDRFVEAGGTFVDTSNNYACWVDGATGDESELLLGRWLASRGQRGRIVVGTKVGARPQPLRGSQWPANAEGLAAQTVREGLQGSLRRLGVERVGVYYAHIEDRFVPLEETVGAFAELVANGMVTVAGCSNHTGERVVRARAIASGHGWAPFRAVEQRHTYLQPAPEADFGVQEYATSGLLEYVQGQQDMTLLSYASLLGGAYDRADRPLPSQYQHAGSERRLAVLREVAAELGVTAGQVVLAWLLRGTPRVIPVLGVSSVRQLNECLASADIKLDELQLARLDAA